MSGSVGTTQQVRFERLSSEGLQQLAQVDGKASVLIKPNRDVSVSGFVNHAV
ncbi:MAG TPA: hypothetical protein VLS53_05230 [Candidatus Dormibacteraeota bacterium]|nr:hypothetical protein [Candidatus Dormibacteraeota bacterium]